MFSFLLFSLYFIISNKEKKSINQDLKVCLNMTHIDNNSKIHQQHVFLSITVIFFYFFLLKSSQNTWKGDDSTENFQQQAYYETRSNNSDRYYSQSL
jgi:hypothetical protein